MNARTEHVAGGYAALAGTCSMIIDCVALPWEMQATRGGGGTGEGRRDVRGVRREGAEGAGKDEAKGAGRSTEAPRSTGGQSRDGDANPSIFVLLLPFRVLPLLLLFICSSSSP